MDRLDADITGVILAGGLSKRMGFNKASADFIGTSMLTLMIEKLQEVTPAVVVSSGSITYPGISYPQIPDEYSHCGPLGGIFSALNASPSILNLILSCDIPLVSVSLLKYIVSMARESGALLTVPVDCDGQEQMLCAVYHRDILPILKRQIDNSQLRMKTLLELVRVKYVQISKEHPLYHEHAFMNVNSKDVLQQALTLWSKKGQ
ncbi:MAG: molybdenum cofactor guanylyltransferase [Porphyromonadaceae bacterium]|nr:molybdenum cofactor guanylyltransferase [Porphyromonadaceae bacterium]